MFSKNSVRTNSIFDAEQDINFKEVDGNAGKSTLIETNEEPFIFQFGLHTYHTSDKREIKYLRHHHEMKYKQSYLAYKMRFCWPFIDILAAYFNLVLNIAVIAFAIYHQISVFYCVCLLFLVLQSLMLSS